MIHEHDFHRIGEVSKGNAAPVGATGVFRGTPGVEVACVSCGQVRRAYVDGVVEITVRGGDPIEDHGGGS